MIDTPLTPEEALYTLESPAFDMTKAEIGDQVLTVFEAYARGTLEQRSLSNDPQACERAKKNYLRQRDLKGPSRVDWRWVLLAAETDAD